LRHTDHVPRPARADIGRVIERGPAHDAACALLIAPDVSGAALGAHPSLRPTGRVDPAVAGERELATGLAPRAFVDDPAHCLRAARHFGACQDHGCNRALAPDRLIAGLEVDGRGEAEFLAHALHPCELRARRTDA